ncbi:MAG TPA: hypothetical protein VN650_01750 [Gemmatimonadaceae bacterium]|nr:hypothetical protein [Gemmatimonadaceae bacterium]
MTLDTFVGFVADHWVMMGLILCPIVIVLMALAALSCEACGAPFGIFRRRSRTIDLCLRCALIHDIRHAGEASQSRTARESAGAGRPVQTPADRDATRDDRRSRSNPPTGLGVAGHAGTH